MTVSADFGIDKEYESKDGKNKFKAEIKGKFNGTFNSGSVDMSATAGMCFEGKLSFGPISASLENTCLAQGSARVTAAKNVLAFSACGAARPRRGRRPRSATRPRRRSSAASSGWWARSSPTRATSTPGTRRPARRRRALPGVSLGSGLDAAMIAVTRRGRAAAGGAARAGRRGGGGSGRGVRDRARRRLRVHPLGGRQHDLRVRRAPAAPGAGRSSRSRARRGCSRSRARTSCRSRRCRRRCAASGSSGTVKPIPGQTVRLREVGPNVSAPLGELRGREGHAALQAGVRSRRDAAGSSPT